ncbi:DegT/DnrJ/EryC1/StrS family aminotransferase [Nonlabens marinus]|uniref:DegT/DnrJ/EryC1/StrS aminotransferase n=1 Tax=Nonlabens marinus S1-08 TaxID=1454201 RepID=W8VQ21_9FLAO|nr:DegT/DnrJ/EryC1/StrS family aminotransferase [Nonlabens marinus]BAO55404.1 DegT/DnrJ/EryC1/StrS aminotransferase [Nonlabens marinus S1-08]
MNRNIPLMDLKVQYESLKKGIDKVIEETLINAAFIGGSAVQNFEKEFADYLGSGIVTSCGNGTDSLEIIMTALEIGAGDEVIVPAMTWISTSEAIVTCGAKPIFADVLLNNSCLDVADVERKITSNTKAVIAVHLHGNMVDMPALMNLCNKHNIKVIEDCAQAHGSSLEGKKVGTWGIAGSFSFFPSKNLGCYGDGGAIYTENKKLSQKIRLIARHGQSSKNEHLINGRNSRLDSLQARILSIKLPHLEKWIDQKNNHAKYYCHSLKDVNELKLPPLSGNEIRLSWHLFVIRLKERDALRNHLKAHHIETGIHYPTALPFQPCYKYLNHTSKDFPIAAKLQDEVLSIPMYAELEKFQLDKIVNCIKLFYTQ